MPITVVFHTFSLDFAGPFPPGPDGERSLLVGVEHLTSWPIVNATVTNTTDVVTNFVPEGILHPFGPPRQIVSDNVICFTVSMVTEMLEAGVIQWNTVAEYAPMSNGRAERMVGSMKKAVSETVLTPEKTCVGAVPAILYGFRRRRLEGHLSPFFLMYEVVPRLSDRDQDPLHMDPCALEPH